jgi:calcineurin-like phosphoesterase family protein
MKTYFTADFHLNHANIITYCNRPFTSLEEMNDTIIKNFNDRVKEGDVIYFLGDFCFKNSKGGKVGEGLPVKAEDLIKQLTGNIIFIKGNHDRNNSLKTNIERLIIKYGGHRINLVHNPDFIDINYPINFVGHVHQHWKFKRIKRGMSFTDCVNVGVDQWGFKPITFEEINREYSKWKKTLIN